MLFCFVTTVSTPRRNRNGLAMVESKKSPVRFFTGLFDTKGVSHHSSAGGGNARPMLLMIRRFL
jgi:hypothetical protein